MESGDGTAPAVLFRLLGPVQLQAGAERITFSGNQGAVLAALLLHADRVVSTQRLAEAVWDRPWHSASASRVRTLISEVRRACAALGADVIHTQRPGYVLKPAAATTDLSCFNSQAALAREAVTAGRYEEALGHYDDALSWWQGAPLGGIRSSFAQARADWLEGLRLDALEERLSVLLALGRNTDVVTEARVLAGEAPLRERLHGHLMEALHESGRRSEALEVYRQFRNRTVEELGLEPTNEIRQVQQRILRSDEIRQAQQRILRSDPPPRQRPDAHRTSLPVPVQLPAPPASFTSRERELSELDRHLTSGTDDVGVAVISGPGGIGKTWLALHWAHRHRDRYPDGQLYANLRGFDDIQEPVQPATVLRHFLGALGVPPEIIPADQEAQAALYRSVLAERRLLIVLDNARDSAQVTPLIPGRPGCAVLVTSRNRLVSLNATHSAGLLEVGAFTDEEARRLLSRHFGPETMAADPASVAVLLEHSGGLPLALGVLAARAVAQPGFPLAVLAQELLDPATRLDALQTGDPGAGLRAVFASSYAALHQPAARLFLLLGTVPGPEIGLPAASALAGLPPAETRTHLSTLETANLVRQLTPGRYRMHDLVRLYAAERAEADLPADVRQQALIRLVEAYTAMAFTTDRALFPHRPSITVAPWEGNLPEPEDTATAMTWFETELPCLLAAQLLASGLGLDTAAWQLAWSTNSFLLRRSYNRERLDSWKIALASARRLDDPHTTAVVLWHTGYAHAAAGDHEAAIHHLDQALALFENLRDRSRLAQVHHTLGWVWSSHGQLRHGLGHAQAALLLQREAGDPIWEANALSALGWIHLQLGDHSAASSACEQALALFRRHQDRGGEAATLDSLGMLALREGEHARALEYYGQSADLRKGTGNAYQGADTLVGLGDAHRALGNEPEARAAWSEALDLYGSQHRLAEVERVKEKLSRIPWSTAADLP
ncbi:DNA-binding SARP family transcriptional activator/predicted negative regulator of RcsB-dependent stress response [Nonomuraea thailandensis]|uniref:DNA-binding SARP family transcriptional activator/predicted negative regulator of RcsB-dependent stress response n=1 Tax=Nonomuraea thailandensis TaxID=1188745 RepID=A0A9X2GYJ4_9ACTN|nr:BTAD domain-containing putative transcriptional regulator [Nonomuraea thailandensis]MCP2364156.1 DNA-binding SARP family transcriptional activator/predicted negative regulator of RcsB-dependent stress response [Nonomuraea thailandensis]